MVWLEPDWSCYSILSVPKVNFWERARGSPSINRADRWAAGALRPQTPAESVKEQEEAQDLWSCHTPTAVLVVLTLPYLWLAVLLDPAKDAGRQFLEAVYWNRVAERLKQGVHNALKDAKLDLVRDLILSLLRVVLVSLHYVLIVPKKKDIEIKPTGLLQTLNFL